MKVLEAQPEVAPGGPPAPPPASAPEEAAPEAGARTCRSCGDALAPGQDWCLTCGAAAERVRDRPGARAAAAVLGLMLLLVAGAVIASYAALRQDRDALAPATTQAQVTPPPAATTTPVPDGSADAPPPATTTDAGSLPKVKPPSSTATTATVPTPPTPAPVETNPAATSDPPASVSSSAGSSSSSPSGSSSSGTTTPTPPSGSSGPTTTTPPTPTPAPDGPVAIDLKASAGSTYDPYKRASALGVPGEALDSDAATAWFAEVPAGETLVGVGYAVDLGRRRGIRAVDVTTTTPGYRVEVYAAIEATPPPDILDTRWAHIANKTIGEDGANKTRITIGGEDNNYRTLLLWITKPPTDGLRATISKLKVLG